MTSTDQPVSRIATGDPGSLRRIRQLEEVIATRRAAVLDSEERVQAAHREAQELRAAVTAQTDAEIENMRATLLSAARARAETVEAQAIDEATAWRERAAADRADARSFVVRAVLGLGGEP
ncbi:MAG: hypothetical protein ACRCSN_16445 [Dermatophilaceae bacterium]